MPSPTVSPAARASAVSGTEPTATRAEPAVQARHDTTFPWGTLTVNVAGCLVLGLLAGAATTGAAPASAQLLIGTGLCGALTTYSTFSYETVRLAETGQRLLAVANAVGSVTAGIGATFIGDTIARGLWP